MYSKKCKKCGKEFLVKFKCHLTKYKYCSHECTKKGITLHDKKCENCGIAFKTRERRAKNCSMECAVKVAGRKRGWGAKNTRAYSSWNQMKNRCLAKTNKDYSRWGARGIKVCDRWMDFENFFADMGERPEGRYSLDRIDNNGNYEPGNCRWATPLEQSRNQRSNRKFEYKGMRFESIRHAADYIGIKRSTFEHRLKNGWSIERIFTTPTIWRGQKL